jgi:hypothetical protein
MAVVIVEPLVDLAVLAGVKAFNLTKCNIFFDKKLVNCKA